MVKSNKWVKPITSGLSAVIVIGCLMKIHVSAQTLTDYYFQEGDASTPSESWDGSSSDNEFYEVELEGIDEIQNKKSTQLINLSQYQESYEVEVYASLPSEFTVSIPKIITLDASGKTDTRFAVGVKGSLAPNYAVTSTADSLIKMTNSRDERITFNALISTYTDSLTLSYMWNFLDANSYNGDSIGYYNISNDKIPVAGTYMGTFNIQIDLVDLS